MIVVKGKILKMWTVCEDVCWQRRKLVVVQGEGRKGAEGGEDRRRKGGELVVGDHENVEIVQGTQGCVLYLGEEVVLEVEDLESLLVGE